jgi:hypothetical protein|tara:strand:- start:762 stop:1310 length:549 start_codon:yes stop_codon:yes gene_type:complete
MTGIISNNVGRDSGLIKATAGASNKPYFMAYRGTNDCSGDACNYNFSDNSYVKTPFNNEAIDSDSCYDVSNYRFTPNVAGKYFVFASVRTTGGTLDRWQQGYYEIRKNNTREVGSYYDGGGQSSGYTRDYSNTMYLSTVVDMNGSSDYLEVYMKVDESSSTPWLSGGPGNYFPTYFGAYKLA